MIEILRKATLLTTVDVLSLSRIREPTSKLIFLIKNYIFGCGLVGGAEGEIGYNGWSHKIYRLCDQSYVKNRNIKLNTVR